MASNIKNEAKRAVPAGEIDLNADPLYTILVMSNTTTDTENDAIVHIGDLTTLDEFDGTGYNSSARQELDSIAVNKDDANDRAEFDAADEAYSSLGNGTRQIQGVDIYHDPDDDGDTADDATNNVLFFIEFTATINPGGSTLTIQWDTEGIVQFS